MNFDTRLFLLKQEVLFVPYGIDTINYVTRIGNSSRAPIVIVDFATAHPGCDFLPNFVQNGQRN